MRIAGGAGALAACAVLSSAALADDDAFLAPYDNSGTFTFVWENDYFANTDRNYTNGIRLSYLSGFKAPEGVSRWVADSLLGVGEAAGVRRGFALGHSIFTPQDTEASALLPDQHPYAGWLYGEYSVVVEQTDIIDQFTLQAGVIGPSAGGEFVQNNWHDLIGGEAVNGWDNQLRDEPGVVISYDRKLRALFKSNGDGLGFDATPSYGASFGNVYTNARVGLMVRIGSDLRNDYGPPRVRPSLAGGGYFSPRDRFSWYVFAGAEGRAVAHDIFLEGSLFRDNDLAVDNNILVGDFQAGLVMQVRRVQVAYTSVFRTREFKTQQGAQQFGAVSLSVKF